MFRKVPFLVCALLIFAPSARAVEVGDTVLAYWSASRAYYIGTAVEKADGGYLVVFEDGDQGVIPENKIRKFDLKVGSPVIARWTNGQLYPGKIARVAGKAFYIHYDDGDKLWVPWSWITLKE